MATNRYRNWFIRVSLTNNTKQGLYVYNFEELYQTLVDKYERVVMAIHDKDTENVHCHIILQNKTQIKFDTLKGIIPYGDLEPQNGTNKECYEYLFHKDKKSKEKEKDEYDESCIKTNIEDIESWLNIKNGKGARNDIIEFKNAVLGGASFGDLVENHTNALASNLGFYKELVKFKRLQEFKAKEREVDVTYIYGAPGAGKTRSVYKEYGYDTVYSVDDYSHPFDSYDGENVLLLDEYHSNFPITYFLKLLDRYPLKLKARYENKIACFTKVIIISNIPLDEQYKGLDSVTRQALLRRIKTIKHIISNDKVEILKQTQKFEQVDIGNIF